MSIGQYNTFVGNRSGRETTSDDNTFLGYEAGFEFTTGSGNVCIGSQAGPTSTYATSSNLLFIDNGKDDTPLIYGDFANDRIGIAMIATTNALEVNGDASKTSSGDWSANSDARLKKEITNLNGEEILDKMMQLQGITYYWNDTVTGYERPQQKQFGFTAQNIQEVFPILVQEDKLGYLQTSYGTYDAMYVECIKELYRQIQAIKLENEVLKQEVISISASKETSSIR